MTAGIGLGLLLALASAAALNWGYFVQHSAAAALPPLSLRRPVRSLLLLFRNRRWLIGFWSGIGGWVFYVVALKLAPLSIVQAASAGGIALLAGLVGRLSNRERAAVAVAVAGLLMLGISLVRTGAPTGHGSISGVAVWMAVSVSLAGLSSGPASRLLAGGAGLGTAAGVLYSAGDVGTKAAVAGGVRLAFVPALLACHGLAFVALQLGFQRGRALATAGLATLWTNALPIAAGWGLFGEALPGGWRGVMRAAAFASVVLAAAVLARPEPTRTSPAPQVAREAID